MRRLFASVALTLAALAPVTAFEAGTEAVLDRLKTGKLVPIAEVGQLMMASERWCYLERDGACSWSDIYLEVTADTATYEIGNAWDAEINVQFTDHGTFKEGRYICETGYDWVPTIRAQRQSDGAEIGGRELFEIKRGIAEGRSETIDCFDYVLQGTDDVAQTITLLQRQYTDDVHIPENDVAVTVHFDAEAAASLTWYY